LRYVGNLRKENGDYFNRQYDKAIFPPNSEIPDMVSENSQMYNPMNSKNSYNENSNNNDNIMRDENREVRFPLKNDENGNNLRDMNGNMMMDNHKMNMQTDYQHNMGVALRRPSGGCMANRPLSDFLCSYMGKYITAEFLFGSDTYVKKTGILNGMGMNYIILDINGTTTVCDLTDAKFINISSDDLI